MRNDVVKSLTSHVYTLYMYSTVQFYILFHVIFVKVKAFPVPKHHIIKTYRWSEGKAPHTF